MKKVYMFSGSWCGPCRQSKPHFLMLKEERKDVHFEIIDIDENPVMANNFQVSVVPTFVILEDDKEIGRVVADVRKIKELI
jgi:thioredoxin 1